MDSVRWQSRTFAPHGDRPEQPGNRETPDGNVVANKCTISIASRVGVRDRGKVRRIAARERALRSTENRIEAATRLKAAGLHVFDRMSGQLQQERERLEQGRNLEGEKSEPTCRTNDGAQLLTERGENVVASSQDSAMSERRLKFFHSGMERRAKAAEAKRRIFPCQTDEPNVRPESPNTLATRKAREQLREDNLANRCTANAERASVRACRVAMRKADSESYAARELWHQAKDRRDAFDRAFSELQKRMEQGFLPNQNYGRMKLFALQGLRNRYPSSTRQQEGEKLARVNPRRI